MSAPLSEHPDPIIESFLRILQRTGMALARCGCLADARARFEEGMTVGQRMGPPPRLAGFRSLATDDALDPVEPPPVKKDRSS